MDHDEYQQNPRIALLYFLHYKGALKVFFIFFQKGAPYDQEVFIYGLIQVVLGECQSEALLQF